MSLRTKIVVWFLLLSVVPLAAIVSYSYVSSTRALRSAVSQETWELAIGLQDQMDSTTTELASRVQGLHALPWQKILVRDWEAEGEMGGEYEAAFGGLAPFVESLEFVPAEPAAAPEPPAAVLVPEAIAQVAPPAEAMVIELGSPTPEDMEAFEAAWSSTEGWSAWAEAASDENEVRLEVAHEALEAMRGAFENGELGGARTEQFERLGERMAVISEMAVRRMSAMEAKEIERHELKTQEAERVLGQAYVCPVEVEGEEIGSLRANVDSSRLVALVLARTDRSQGEIPFAYDADGRVYLAMAEDQPVLESIGLISEGRLSPSKEAKDWVVAYMESDDSDLTFGIARPIQDSVRDLRTTAGRNFGLGFGLVGLALIGVVPLSRRLTRDLEELAAGAELLAAGDWDARVPVRSRDEVGKLAGSFNHLARELSDNQQRLLDTQVTQRLLVAENERKSGELEEAREFQLSLLPSELPDHPQIDVAVFMRTATEVGGDYYDFKLAHDGTLTTVVGDATGHGAKAGTMVTVIKSLFTAWSSSDALAEFLSEAAASIKRMELGRMAMALVLARIEGLRLKVSSAGMPPVLVCRASGSVEELALSGLPLGGMARVTYEERRVDLERGDTVLLMSDGFPELPNAEGEPIGYDRVRQLLVESCDGTPQEIIQGLAQFAADWRPGEAPSDDITFVALRLRDDP